MSDTERRYYNAEIVISRDAAGNETRNVEGYAAIFEELSLNLGYFREKIAAGAFDGVLDGDTVAAFNHDYNLVLARTTAKTLALSVDSKGLLYRFAAPNTTAGNDLLENIRNGNVAKSSFAFTIDQQTWSQDEEYGDIRTVQKVKRLYDVSPVVFPAYPQTEVANRFYEEWKKGEHVTKQTKLGIYERRLRLKKLIY